MRVFFSRWLAGLYIDPRSIKLFRTIIGSICVLMGSYLHYEWHSLMSDFGMLPFSSAPIAGFNVFLLGSSEIYHRIIFSLLLLLGLGLIFDLAPRINSIILFFIVKSLTFRLAMAANSGFVVLYLSLILSALLPPCRRVSANAGRTSLASLVTLLQVPFLFLPSVVLKLKSPYWVEGLALHNALHVDNIVGPLGELLRVASPSFLVSLSYAVLGIEILAPCALLLGGFSERLRLAACLILLSLPIGFIVFLRIGIFPWTVIALISLCLPRTFWDSPIFRTRFTLKNSPFVNESAVTRVCAVGLALFYLFSMLLSNLHSVYPPIREPLNWMQTKIFVPLGISQNWNMFTLSDWPSFSFSISAVNSSAQSGNLWAWWADGAKPARDLSEFPLPAEYSPMKYPWGFWREIVFNCARSGPNRARLAELARYICYQYNLSHSEKLKMVTPRVSTKITKSFDENRKYIPREMDPVRCPVRLEPDHPWMKRKSFNE